MKLVATLIMYLVLLDANDVIGIDLNSVIPRFKCYSEEQANCNEELVDCYPELSKSVTNLTVADTWFWLFTRDNQDEPENLHKCGGSLPPNSKFDPTNRLIVILTPFFEGFCDIAAYRELKTQFLIREDVNVLAVDWTWGNRLDYATALLNLKIVANQTIKVLQNIQNETGIEYNKIYLVGHSLGAQMAGIIGHNFRVGRITGLDPSGPGYDKKETPASGRLDRNDADLVDVWHTDMGDCLPSFGMNYDAGDVDYYINGGQFQPQCYSYALTSFLKGDYLYGLLTLNPYNCFHSQSLQYYKVTINPGDCQFVGVKCATKRLCQTTKFILPPSCGRDGSNCMIVGYDLDKFYKSTGSPQRYYVETNMTCPWCDNHRLQLQGFQKTYRKSLQSY